MCANEFDKLDRWMGRQADGWKDEYIKIWMQSQRDGHGWIDGWIYIEMKE